MLHIDKFWSTFRDKLASHQPDAYTNDDWLAMEQLLSESSTPPKKKTKGIYKLSKMKRLWIMILLMSTSAAGALTIWQKVKHGQHDSVAVSTNNSITTPAEPKEKLTFTPQMLIDEPSASTQAASVETTKPLEQSDSKQQYCLFAAISLNNIDGFHSI